ncbi:hypothetical protein BCR35DRAFT_165097 [Leucosporidium creatinivorum]|uniref:Uncharacterized protein n=1 Tax=Leucosporidium creatinivorum TaxID=106004 RepID=A0A1Y2ELQ4_9BASI|nr:hypothetical protein BCR35DRAFT_165097 [Leucosporidium creatinivorum]
MPARGTTHHSTTHSITLHPRKRLKRSSTLPAHSQQADSDSDDDEPAGHHASEHKHTTRRKPSSSRERRRPTKSRPQAVTVSVVPRARRNSLPRPASPRSRHRASASPVANKSRPSLPGAQRRPQQRAQDEASEGSFTQHPANKLRRAGSALAALPTNHRPTTTTAMPSKRNRDPETTLVAPRMTRRTSGALLLPVEEPREEGARGRKRKRAVKIVSDTEVEEDEEEEDDDEEGDVEMMEERPGVGRRLRSADTKEGDEDARAGDDEEEEDSDHDGADHAERSDGDEVCFARSWSASTPMPPPPHPLRPPPSTRTNSSRASSTLVPRATTNTLAAPTTTLRTESTPLDLTPVTRRVRSPRPALARPRARSAEASRGSTSQHHHQAAALDPPRKETTMPRRCPFATFAPFATEANRSPTLNAPPPTSPGKVARATSRRLVVNFALVATRSTRRSWLKRLTLASSATARRSCEVRLRTRARSSSLTAWTRTTRMRSGRMRVAIRRPRPSPIALDTAPPLPLPLLRPKLAPVAPPRTRPSQSSTSRAPPRARRRRSTRMTRMSSSTYPLPTRRRRKAMATRRWPTPNPLRALARPKPPVHRHQNVAQGLSKWRHRLPTPTRRVEPSRTTSNRRTARAMWR